jgi:hypothetical protein
LSARAARLVEAIRGDSRPGLMEVFLAEYGLSTDEGVALMCLAEALLRVPDADHRRADRGQDRAVAMGPASRPFQFLAGQRLDLGADADRQGAGNGPVGRAWPGCCAVRSSGWASR